MSDRVERNWKMANAASPNVTRPPSKLFLENYDLIFRKKHTTKHKIWTPKTKLAKKK